jgi:hypothetical protein
LLCIIKLSSSHSWKRGLSSFSWNMSIRREIVRVLTALTVLVLAAGAVLAEPGQIWCEPDANLCWQNPQRAGFDL